MTKTIPDLIEDIKYKCRAVKDIPLSWIESIGSRMSVYAWNKRWGNRYKGTGYKERHRYDEME
jgi:hypothetical protein